MHCRKLESEKIEESPTGYLKKKIPIPFKLSYTFSKFSYNLNKLPIGARILH